VDGGQTVHASASRCDEWIRPCAACDARMSRGRSPRPRDVISSTTAIMPSTCWIASATSRACGSVVSVAVRLALDCGSLGDQPQSLRCRRMDGEDTSRPAPVAAGEESDARLPRQSPGACFLTQDASPVRAARLSCDGSGDAPAPRGRRRPPSSAERWKANDDRGVSLGRPHEEGDADSSEANGTGEDCGSCLREGEHHRSRLLRLQVRPDWSRSERDRAASDPWLCVCVTASASADDNGCSADHHRTYDYDGTAAGHNDHDDSDHDDSELRAELPGRLYPAAA
jgi:hypothetical protein